VSDKAIDYLAANQTLTQSYDVKLDDGHGGTAIQTVTITLVGASDAAKTAGGAKGGGKGAAGANGADLSQDGAATIADGHSIFDDQSPAPASTDTLVFKSFPPSQEYGLPQGDAIAHALEQATAAGNSVSEAVLLALPVHGVLDGSDQHGWLFV
jgi:hypothetical protein